MKKQDTYITISSIVFANLDYTSEKENLMVNNLDRIKAHPSDSLPLSMLLALHALNTCIRNAKSEIKMHYTNLYFLKCRSSDATILDHGGV